jgi:hypothetical protein
MIFGQKMLKFHWGMKAFFNETSKECIQFLNEHLYHIPHYYVQVHVHCRQRAPIDVVMEARASSDLSISFIIM